METDDQDNLSETSVSDTEMGDELALWIEGRQRSFRDSEDSDIIRHVYMQEDSSLEISSSDEEPSSNDDYDLESVHSIYSAVISSSTLLKYDPTPDTQYPKPDWSTVEALHRRKYGLPGKSLSTFSNQATGSLWAIQRLKKTRTLYDHDSCVNSLNFSSTGKLLCSGSDDTMVLVWDWSTGKILADIESGHESNVVDSYFCNSDRNIVTGSRDGTVRLIDIETSHSEELLLTSDTVNPRELECKIGFTSQETIVVASEDGFVYMIDLKSREVEILFEVKDKGSSKRCNLTTIATHPINKYILAVAGFSNYVYIYDLRFLKKASSGFASNYIHKFDALECKHNIVTSLAFNSIGDKLLINYADDDLVVCRTDTYEVIHRYKGHRNKQSIKNCLWFGNNYVMTGSDDGHIYGWELDSEHIVCFLYADSQIVNTLSLHPTIPVLASAGLDWDIKIWEPIADTWPQTLKGIKQHICRNTWRKERNIKARNDIRYEMGLMQEELNS